jgi:hypothetical protein
MSICRAVTLAFLFTAACGRRDEAPMPPPLPPPGAARTTPPTGALKLLGNPDGFNPLSLNQPVTVTAKANEATSVALPVPFSAQSAWVAIRGKAAATLTGGGQSFSVEAGASDTWQLLPLLGGVVSLTADVDVELSVRASGYFDQSGAGLTVAAEAPLEQRLSTGPTQLALAPASATEPDDTWGVWLRLTVTAEESDIEFELRGCGLQDALEVLQVSAGQTKGALVLAPRGAVCVYSSGTAALKVEPVARYRRFTRTSWRSVSPVAVLDTENGVGWRGVPVASQQLEVDLSKLQGAEGATVAVLRVSGGGAPVLAGACGGTLSALEGSDLLLHGLGTPLCISPSRAAHVRAELIALATPGDAAPLECPALPAAAPCAANDLLGRLNCVPGVVATSNGMPDQYLIELTQPVDHARPDGATFQQRILLTYVGPDAPFVLHTTGYELFSFRSDLGKHLSANELEVEHRFFGTSTPMPRDFTTMNIVQSAHDSHHIVELLRPVLQGHWLNTGHSKGGMTALFHRRFFPCDVDGSVPYVTPLSYSMDDERYGKALQQLGGDKYAACRQVFRDLDRAIISQKSTLGPSLTGTYMKLGGPEVALWELTGLMSWSLFQYEKLDDPSRGCPAYQAVAASPPEFAQLVAAYAKSAEGFSDQSLATAENDPLFGYTYQTTNELGAQGASRDHLTDLGPVPALPQVGPLSLGSVPVPQYEPRSMRDVQDWVKAHGSRFIFVYGEFDPWFAGSVDIDGAPDALKLVAPAMNHGAGFADLTQADQLAMDAALHRWLGSNGPRPVQRHTASSLDAQPEFKDVMKVLKL